MIKLLHITATHLNPSGGVPVVLKELVEEQNKIEGFSTRVLSLSAPVKQMESLYFDELGDKTIIRYLSDYAPDIVILHSFYYLQYNKVVTLLKKENIPFYIEPHGSFGHAAMNKSKIKKFIANNTIFRSQIRNAMGYIFLNKEEKADSIYHKEADIIIPNGINDKKISQKNIQKTQNVNFYFIGRYDINHKGLDYLFDALDIIEQKKESSSFHFWGNGDNECLAYMHNRASQYHYVKIEISSPIYGSVKDELLEQYGPMILTSRYEGFPITVLEAWAYGNPCIVTLGTNVGEEIAINNLGWCVELSAESISNGIITAKKEFLLQKNNYAKRCKKYVADNYSWKKIASISYEQISAIIESKWRRK